MRLYEIAVAVELGDAGRALQAATEVDTGGLSAERRARMLIDVARAHAQRRQGDVAVAALLQAEAITPEQSAGTPWFVSSSRICSPCRNPPAPELRDLAKRLTVAMYANTLCISNVFWVL